MKSKKEVIEVLTARGCDCRVDGDNVYTNDAAINGDIRINTAAQIICVTQSIAITDMDESVQNERVKDYGITYEVIEGNLDTEYVTISLDDDGEQIKIAYKIRYRLFDKDYIDILDYCAGETETFKNIKNVDSDEAMCDFVDVMQELQDADVNLVRCYKCDVIHPDVQSNQIGGTGEYICDKCLRLNKYAVKCVDCGDVYHINNIQQIDVTDTYICKVCKSK